MSWWQQPFFQVALPIIVAFAVATWFQSKAIDGVSKRIDDINKRIDDLSASMGKRIDDLRDAVSKRLEAIEMRLAKIETLLVDHDRRITTLEERTSPLRR